MSTLSGHLFLRAERDERGATFIARQAFRAPFHVGKTHWEGGTLLAQVVNPTAGILEGDRLESEISVGPGASLLVTTPSASRVFKMTAGGTAESRQRFNVEAGGMLEYWPEMLVPHTGSSFRQATEITLETGAEAVIADFFMPGRIERGEKFSWEKIRLELLLRIGEQLVLRERFEQSGAELERLAQLAGHGAGVCFANVILVSTRLGETDAGGPWRAQIEALHRDGVWVGASALRVPHAWSLKLIAPNGIALRETYATVRRTLGDVWPALAFSARKL